MLGRPAPLCFIWLGAAGNGIHCMHMEQGTKLGALNVQGASRPAPGTPAGSPPPPMSRHHRKERYNLKVYEVEHRRGSLSAVERPTGLGLALLYKTQRWRHFSMQQKLRFACLSPSSSISYPFLKSLYLIKLF